MPRLALAALLLVAVPAAAPADEGGRDAAGLPYAARVVPRERAPAALPPALLRAAERRAFWRNLFWTALGATAAVVVLRFGRRR